MNALRILINSTLDEEEVDGCVVHTDILHKKIQKIALDLLNEDIAVEGGLQAENEDTELIRQFITYCSYDYEEARYLDEYEPPEHIRTLGRGYTKRAIEKFLEDIR